MTDASIDPRLLMQAALDGELDASGQLAFERTLAGDPTLAKEYERLVALRRTLRENFPRETAPPALLTRVEGLVDTSSAVLPFKPRSASGATRVAGMGLTRFAAMGPTRFAAMGLTRFAAMGIAASVALGMVIGGGTTWWEIGRDQQPGLVDELVSGHRRALLAEAPVDIASNDRHNVRPWFDAHIAVSPPAPDLSAQGFPLLGGRVDVFDGAPAPTLVYRIHEHFVSVTALPASRSAGSDAPAGGYHVLSWRGIGFTFWAVTDADLPELDKFVGAFKAAATNGTEMAPSR
jgi:anti-sigma factor RsiW